MKINIKRIYEPASPSDGYRILVDRLWPRGIKKENAGIDLWLKNIGPSTSLRKWFAHDPDKWQDFKDRYKKELKDSPELDELKAEAKKHNHITLLYGARDKEHNHTLVLLKMLNAK